VGDAKRAKNREKSRRSGNGAKPVTAGVGRRNQKGGTQRGEKKKKKNEGKLKGQDGLQYELAFGKGDNQIPTGEENGATETRRKKGTQWYVD